MIFAKVRVAEKTALLHRAKVDDRSASSVVRSAVVAYLRRGHNNHAVELTTTAGES